MEGLVPNLTDLFKAWTGQLANWVEIVAAVIIGIAVVEAIVHAVPLFLRRDVSPGAREALRLRLGRWLAVALEFELAADILRTAIAPTWGEIGQLAAIATIRTALNYFLQQEIEREADAEAAASAPRSPTAARFGDRRSPSNQQEAALGREHVAP
jgi:uncharacterized membrane protein